MNTLRLSFLVIVISLCLVTLITTGDLITGKMSLDSYKGLLEILGIPTLIGVIVQSFLHTNLQQGETSEKANPTSSVISNTDTSTSTDNK